MKQQISILLIAIMAIMSACKGPELARQQLIYFKNLKDSAVKTLPHYESVVQKGDLLGLFVSGSILEKDAAAPIVEVINSQANTGESKDVTQSTSTGYMVDEAGNMNIPFVGTIKAEGLKLVELAEIIKEKLKTNLPEPVVNLRFINHKIIVLGEVTKPGPQQMINDRVTILDAISQAGDLAVSGKRENILIIREKGGVKEVGHVNLNDGNIFTSPYYFLKPDDIVYVEVNKLKIPASQTNSNIQYVQIGLAVLTSISLIINIFK